MRERSDEVLMQAYAGGDMAAFELLYNRHRGPLYRFILRLVGDAATANDLYQGSWEKVIRARQKYRPTAPFKAWLYRIARNHVVDHFRQARPVAEVSPEKLEAGNPGPDAILAGQQTAAGLAAAVQQLPEEQREVLVLKMDVGLDLDTIAQITGTNRETAKSRLRYAVAKLRKSLMSSNDGKEP